MLSPTLIDRGQLGEPRAARMPGASPVPTRGAGALCRALSDVKTFRADVQIASLHVEVDLD